MFFLFISFIYSIFIPYNDPNPLYRTLSANEAEHLSRNVGEVLAVSLSADQQESEKIIHTLNIAAIYFKDLHFCLLDPESAKNLTKESEIELPAVFLYIRGVIFASYPYPDEEESFLRLCKLIITPHEKPLTTLNELYSEIGANPFAIITPVDSYPLAKSLQYQISSQLGTVDVICIDQSLLNSLGMKDTPVAFLRKEDMSIVPIELTEESVFEAITPIYRVLMQSDITNDEDIVFAMICDEFGDQERDFLYELGMRYDDFVIGYGNQVSDYLEKFNHPLNGDAQHEIIVCNFPKGYFYNASTYFGHFHNLPFDTRNWVSASCKMLNDIKSGKLQPTFLTEDPPDPSENNPYVPKIVGTTYEQFIMDPEHDVVILYKRDNCPHCTKFFPVFSAFAKECSDANLTFIKFGFIDISRNAANIPFPYMPGVPHVEFFPANNKTDHSPLRMGRDRNSLIRMIKLYSNHSEEIPFEIPPIDKSQLAAEMVQMLFGAKDMPEEEKVKALLFMDKMSKEAGLKKGDEL